MSGDVPDYSRSWAVLIGTSVYSDPQFPPLPAVANSLRGMRELLTDPGLCAWPAERTRVLKDPSDVRRLVQTLRRLARESADVLLVYFAGHGTISRRGKLCMILTDTESTDTDITGLEFERVREVLLHDSPARTKIVILDCCYSGRAIEVLAGADVVADSTEIHGAFTMTASDHTAHVVALDQQPGAPTSFTGELLDLVRTGIVDGPAKLTLNDVYVHLRHRLQVRGLPAPNHRGTDTAGRYAFARNVAALPPPPARVETILPITPSPLGATEDPSDGSASGRTDKTGLPIRLREPASRKATARTRRHDVDIPGANAPAGKGQDVRSLEEMVSTRRTATRVMIAFCVVLACSLGVPAGSWMAGAYDKTSSQQIVFTVFVTLVLLAVTAGLACGLVFSIATHLLEGTAGDVLNRDRSFWLVVGGGSVGGGSGMILGFISVLGPSYGSLGAGVVVCILGWVALTLVRKSADRQLGNTTRTTPR
jgi:hypothetical protein